MPVPESLKAAVGKWFGTSKLHLPFKPEAERVTESKSTAELRSVNDQFMVLEYMWEYEGKQEHGTMLIACSTDDDATTIGWCDSWHQNPAVMRLAGVGAGVVNCFGNYTMKQYSDWGWRIAVGNEGDKLKIEMFNVSPDGSEEWAISATYSRQ